MKPEQNNQPKNKLESLNRDFCGLNFIKKYEVLTTTNLNEGQIKVIEIVLSFQLAGQTFYMSRARMGELMGNTEGYAKNLVSQLKKLGLITTDQKHKAKQSGSKSPIVVDMDALCVFIESFKNKDKEESIMNSPKKQKEAPAKPVEVPTPQPAVEVVEAPQPVPTVEEIKVEAPAPSKEQDLVEELIDKDAGAVAEEDTDFNAEMERMFQSMQISKKKNDDSFDADKWLRSFEDSTGYEHCDEIYQNLIREVNKHFSYKTQITMDDYLNYFKWGNYKESQNEFLGSGIYEAHKKNKRNKTAQYN